MINLDDLNKGAGSRRLTVRLGDALIEDLSLAAKEEHRDRSALVKDAVRFYLVRSEGVRYFETMMEANLKFNNEEISRFLNQQQAWFKSARSFFETTAEALANEVLKLREEVARLSEGGASQKSWGSAAGNISKEAQMSSSVLSRHIPD